jgi:hypothetical protein
LWKSRALPGFFVGQVSIGHELLTTKDTKDTKENRCLGGQVAHFSLADFIGTRVGVMRGNGNSES